MTDDKRTSTMARFRAYLREKGLRCTAERDIIAVKVARMTGLFDADAVREAVESDGQHVSRATIYSTLNLLEEFGLLRSHRIGKGAAQYEKAVAGTKSNHFLTICTQCGKIKEVKDIGLIQFMNSLRVGAFKVQYYQLYVHGVCNACSRRAKRLEREREMERRRQEREQLRVSINSDKSK